MLWLCFYPDGVLVEDAPNGDRNVELSLPEEHEKTIQCLLDIESFKVAAALGALVTAGCSLGERKGPSVAP